MARLQANQEELQQRQVATCTRRLSETGELASTCQGREGAGDASASERVEFEMTARPAGYTCDNNTRCNLSTPCAQQQIQVACINNVESSVQTACKYLLVISAETRGKAEFVVLLLCFVH